MFERFWVREEREKHFQACFTLSFAFTFVAILLTHRFVPFTVKSQNLKGIVSVLLASLAASYPLIRYLERRLKEEDKTDNLEEKKLLRRHWTELKVYIAFFLGASLAFLISSYFLPSEFFMVQSSVIGSITGNIISPSLFFEIISNNLSVFFLTFILSFLLTAGMVFVLVWNASVLGVFLSKVSKSILHLPVVSISYIPHGILEVGGYILAGISGFFLSHEIEEFAEWDEKGKAIKLMEDSSFVLILGLLFLILGAVLESLAL